MYQQVSRDGAGPETAGAQPLAGVRVLDLTHAFSGPMCTYLLALLGAEVIKVEKRGEGDEFRRFYATIGETGMNPVFMGLNGGKKSVTLDLKAAEGRAILHRLVGECDVLVQNYRPGAAEKIGADWDTCRAINPRLIYCAISGFGQTGPLRDWPAYDHTVQAMSGLMSVNGDADSDEPVKVGFTIIDFMSGHLAHSAVLSALLQRQHTHSGQFIDVGMLDAAILMMMGPMARYTIGGAIPPRQGNRAGRGGAVVVLRTGRGHIFLGANYQHQFEALCRALDAPEILADARFATYEARDVHADELAVELEKRLARESAIEWERRLMEAGCPAGAVRSIAEAADHEHVKARRTFLETEVEGMDHPVRMLGPGYRFAHSEPRLQGPPPALGSHTDEVLGSLGFDGEAIARLRAAKVV